MRSAHQEVHLNPIAQLESMAKIACFAISKPFLRTTYLNVRGGGGGLEARRELRSHRPFSDSCSFVRRPPSAVRGRRRRRRRRFHTEQKLCIAGYPANLSHAAGNSCSRQIDDAGRGSGGAEVGRSVGRSVVGRSVGWSEEGWPARPSWSKQRERAGWRRIRESVPRLSLLLLLHSVAFKVATAAGGGGLGAADGWGAIS